MPLTNKQADGIIILVVITALVYVFNLLVPLFLPANHPNVPFSSKEEGELAIALNVNGSDIGVYFMPQGARLSCLMAAAQTDLPRPFSGRSDSRRLKAGDKIYLTGDSSPSIVIGKMSASQALALELPLDINSATFDDLVLVSGIGEKTAARIIALRKNKGGLRRIEELMEIKGIKEKKLDRIKKYFYTEML
ncbi:MAG TPA: helix-hairpin-helix domain-containing protein [Syntrophales bacterium]|nr:helix-hairpin-helix domain-containing protein [Syntrophales bacterium]